MKLIDMKIINSVLPNSFGARFWQVHFEQTLGLRFSKRKLRRLSGRVWKNNR